MEKRNIVKSFKDEYGKRKYIYLSEQGEKHFGVPGLTFSDKRESIIHDAKLTELARSFSKLSCVREVILEHQLSIKRPELIVSSIDPDAVIIGTHNNVSFVLALELELSRKSKHRIKEKIDSFLGQNKYLYILYFFAYEGIYEFYKNFIVSTYGKKINGKIMFFCNEQLLSGDFILNKSLGYFDEGDCLLEEIFI